MGGLERRPMRSVSYFSIRKGQSWPRSNLLASRDYDEGSAQRRRNEASDGTTYLSANHPKPHRTNSCQLYRPMPMSWMALLMSFDLTAAHRCQRMYLEHIGWTASWTHAHSSSTAGRVRRLCEFPSSDPLSYTLQHSSAACRCPRPRHLCLLGRDCHPRPWPGRIHLVVPRTRICLSAPSGCADGLPRAGRGHRHSHEQIPVGGVPKLVTSWLWLRVAGCK